MGVSVPFRGKAQINRTEKSMKDQHDNHRSPEGFEIISSKSLCKVRETIQKLH